MPNFRGRGSNNNRNSRYNEHDNRTVSFRSRGGRGGSFKSRPPKKNGYFNKRNDYGPGPRSRFADEDDDMGDDISNRTNAGPSRRFSPYGNNRDDRRGGGSRGNRNYRGGKRPTLNKDQIMNQLGGAPRDLEKSDWYKVTIPQGKKTEKFTLLKLIAEQLNNVPFVPFNFTTEGLNAVFFLDNQETAKQVRSLSKKVTVPTGFKLLIIVRASAAPTYPPQMTKDILEKLKVAMSNRYDPATKLLNLAEFYADIALKQEGLYLSLHKFAVMKEVLSVIENHIPELETLDLTNNGIYSIDALQRLNEVTPNLKKISLAQNELRNINDLDAIRKLPIEEIVLDGNPLCDRFKEETSYVSALRKKFPKLEKLDGHQLAAQIKVDLESGTIPPTQGSNFGNDTVKPIICRFCQEYFAIYDSGDRTPLMAAYHDTAVFSLSFAYNNILNESAHRQPSFNDYMENSRNLLRLAPGRWHERLQKGKQQIINAISKLPATQHDPDSFVVDTIHASQSLLIFTVSGIFKEKGGKSGREPVRYFTRTFVTAPQGTGIVVVNDVYQLTNARLEQYKNAFKSSLPPVASPAPSISSPSGASAAGPVSSPALSPIQQQMIAQFSQQSTMNLQWSQECLKQSAWDYDKAAAAFTEYKNQGKIPQEAFIK